MSFWVNRCSSRTCWEQLRLQRPNRKTALYWLCKWSVSWRSILRISILYSVRLSICCMAHWKELSNLDPKCCQMHFNAYVPCATCQRPSLAPGLSSQKMRFGFPFLFAVAISLGRFLTSNSGSSSLISDDSSCLQVWEGKNIPMKPILPL